MIQKSVKLVFLIALLVILVSGCELNPGLRSSRGPDPESKCYVNGFVDFLMDNPDASMDLIYEAAYRFGCEELLKGTNYNRPNLLILQSSCPALGDLNGDGAWSVLDIVQLVNCVLASNCDDLSNGCAGDLNGDGNYNVLDIVQLANCVLAQSCSG